METKVKTERTVKTFWSRTEDFEQLENKVNDYAKKNGLHTVQTSMTSVSGEKFGIYIYLTVIFEKE